MSSSKQPMRIRVVRGDRLDVAEWVPGEPAWIGSTALAEGSSGAPALVAAVAAIAVILATVLFIRAQSPAQRRPLTPTVADLQAVHAGVSVRGGEASVAVRRARRLAVGEAVETDENGRARLRLDDGTAVVLDRRSRIEVREGGLSVAAGRVFVLGAPGARAALEVGGATLVVSGADVGISRSTDGAKVYVSRAEITVRASGAETTVRAGDTATIAAGKVSVAPERGFDDWTAGMAAPWSVGGAPRRAVGELWGRTTAGDAGSPLTLRAHDVRAVVDGEVAETEVRTTFFNGGSSGVAGDFRMAIPAGAVVSRFAVGRGENVSTAHVALASRTPGSSTASGDTLEWAGEGWVRGTLPAVAAGEAVTVIVAYTEWLSPRPKGEGDALVVTYRYPMAADAAPPLVGEFSARVEAAGALSLGAGLGARVEGQAVVVRKPDFRPTADLVVDVEIEPWKAPGSSADAPAQPVARLYASPAGDEEEAGSVLVRAELPQPKPTAAGVTLALVVDTSGSIEPALLDAERAVVDAIVGGLGAQDRVVVLAADQTARPLGPPALGPADEARRKAISAALAQIAPGGATDLGRAFEAGADALGPASEAPAGMVIYIGDAWPTVGDATAASIKARLARRGGGAPRLGAVAVGPLANRFALAALTRGVGPLLEVADAGDAARAAVELLAEALRPTVAGVELDLGPSVERVYPRGLRALPEGDTVAAVGRFRGALPSEVTLRWRDAAGAHEERRPVLRVAGERSPDVARRWAAARVEEIALTGRGREAATDVALRAGLLTPWTAFLIGGGGVYEPTRLETRILDLAVGREAGFTAAFATPPASFGALTNVVRETDEDPATDDREDALKGPIAAAARRVIDAASTAVRACRDSRAGLRPELAGTLSVALELDGDGHALGAKVKGSAGADDEGLDRCVEGVILGLAFPASGLKVKIAVAHTVDLPPPRVGPRGRRCSPTSTMPMPLRRGVWRERLTRGDAAGVYLDARHACELPTWTDKRALLELTMIHIEDGAQRLAVARDLDRAGEADAASLLRREAVRRARSPEELRLLRRILIGDEHYPLGLYRKQYGAAGDDGARLAVVRRYLGLAPHDARLHRRLFALLEAMGKKSELAEEIRLTRRDPFADAGLLADGASALRRLGDEAEARRAFGELCERAPADPWARAFLGDRLRNEGWFDDAEAAYAALEELAPNDPAVALRLALAHAGAGRLDIAERLLARVAQTGGRGGEAKLGDLAARLALTLLAEGRGRGTPAEQEQMARAAAELPRPPGATLIVVRAPAGALKLDGVLVRGPKDAREERTPEIAAEGIGLYAFRLDPGDGSAATLKLRRPLELAPSRATRVHIDALVPGSDGKLPRLVSTDLELPISGKSVEIGWNGAAWGG
jgi:tetratricopeptide (TPR) repeat protein